MKKRVLPLLLTLLLSLTYLSGCAGTAPPPLTDVANVVAQNEVLFRAATQYATIKAVQKNPALAPRIAQVAAETAAGLQAGQLIPVAFLEQEVRAKIRWEKLKPEEYILVDALIITVRTELEKAAGELATPEEARVLAAKVLGWVADAATLYAPTAK